jgi:hypothetical protein
MCVFVCVCVMYCYNQVFYPVIEYVLEAVSLDVKPCVGLMATSW